MLGCLLVVVPVKAIHFRCVPSVTQIFPGWFGFNAAIDEDSKPIISVYSYCLVIRASPTRLDTVYTLLKRSVAMTKSIQKNSAVVVLDVAIYAKALQIVWKHQHEFISAVLCIGALHLAGVFLAVIGKLCSWFWYA